MTNILLFNVRYLYLQLHCSFFSITICTNFDMTIHFCGGELRGDQINHAPGKDHYFKANSYRLFGSVVKV